MLEVKNWHVYNIVNAVYSARNPLNSWDQSDSDFCNDKLGEKDLELAKKLCKAGPSHRKFLRQIFVTIDINAPLYWWKEFDTYKIAHTDRVIELELENRTTDVTAKINVKGYKVEDFYMLSSAYAVTSANNGFSTNISDYDDLNVNGTGYTFKNTKDNRMVIVIEEIPAEDLFPLWDRNW